MGEASRRRKQEMRKRAGAVQVGGVRLRVGVFPMVASSAGQARRVRVEFPQQLTTQEKYDVATALAKVAAELVGEADAENGALAAAVAQPEGKAE